MELKEARDCSSFFLPPAPVAPSPHNTAEKGEGTGQVDCGLLQVNRQLRILLIQRGGCQGSAETGSH